ncbi:MAG: helix-turn-helix transcriptional regulator [Cytophagales bacterium]|nr:helix-turn-helix transcriptional regulator [Armatimonadota bacterium]
MQNPESVQDRQERLSLFPGCEGAVWLHENLPSRLSQHRIHRHDEIEFNLVVEGTASYLLSDGADSASARRQEIRPGTLIWLFPAQDHVLLQKSADFSMWILVASPGLCSRACTTESALPLTRSGSPPRITAQFSEQRSAHLRSVLHTLSQGWTHSDTAWLNTGIAYALLTAWRLYQDSQEDSTGTPVHPAVHRAAHLLRTETEPMPLEILSCRVGLSPARLSRLFAAQTGQSITEFRNCRRMDRFLERFDRTADAGQPTPSLLEMALEVGFGSYAQFYRVFREQFGYAPGDHQR